MAPKRKARASVPVATPSAATPARDDGDAMDVDTPQAAETPTTATAPEHPQADIFSPWTADQKAALFAAVIRNKPSGRFGGLGLAQLKTAEGVLTSSSQHQECTGTSA